MTRGLLRYGRVRRAARRTVIQAGKADGRAGCGGSRLARSVQASAQATRINVGARGEDSNSNSNSSSPLPFGWDHERRSVVVWERRYG